MKELDDFTLERLTELSTRENLPEVAALARIVLAAKTAEPVGITDKSEITNLSEPGLVGNFMEPNFKGVDKGDEVYLYTAPVLNSPELPDGWKLVPIEPTESMVIDGFESAPDQFFSEEDEWNAYQEMSGCQQAAHRAKLCWAAMLAAAPKPEK